MTRKSNSNPSAKSLNEENEALEKEIGGLNSEFERISSALKSPETSHGGHKPHPDTEKSLEFVGAEYDDLKGFYEEAKKDLKTLGERLILLEPELTKWLAKSITWSNIAIALMSN